MKKVCTAPKKPSGPADMNKEECGMSDIKLEGRPNEAGYKSEEKYQASENFIHRRIADSDVLISVGANIADFNGYIQINGSALSLWEQLKKTSTLEQLEKVLEDKYGIPHGQAAEDVADFLNELKEHGMVKVR